MSHFRVSLCVLGLIGLLVGLGMLSHRHALAATSPPAVFLGDGPVIRQHINQGDIDAGRLSLEELLRKGREMITASFNSFDGAGRPEATGNGAPTARPPHTFPENFNRSS